MDGAWHRVATQLIARVSVPLKSRFVLQPAGTTSFAIRDGLSDARTGKSPYFATICDDPRDRSELIREGSKSVGNIFILALLPAIVYQLIVLRFVHPGEAIIVACVLALFPCVILLGLVTRAARGDAWPAGTPHLSAIQ